MSLVNPRGQVDLPHFSFAGTHGGPLPVVHHQPVSSDVDENGDQDLSLVEARVIARLAFDPDSSRRLRSGQTGVVHIRGRSGNLGGYVWSGLRRWVSSHITTWHGL